MIHDTPDLVGFMALDGGFGEDFRLRGQSEGLGSYSDQSRNAAPASVVFDDDGAAFIDETVEEVEEAA